MTKEDIIPLRTRALRSISILTLGTYLAFSFVEYLSTGLRLRHGETPEMIEKHHSKYSKDSLSYKLKRDIFYPARQARYFVNWVSKD